MAGGPSKTPRNQRLRSNKYHKNIHNRGNVTLTSVVSTSLIILHFSQYIYLSIYMEIDMIILSRSGSNICVIYTNTCLSFIMYRNVTKVIRLAQFF